MNNTAHQPAAAHLATSRKARERAEAVRWIIEPLRKQGLSLARIAMELNARRIATPAGQTGWVKWQVRRTLGYLGIE